MARGVGGLAGRVDDRPHGGGAERVGDRGGPLAVALLGVEATTTTYGTSSRWILRAFWAAARGPDRRREVWMSVPAVERAASRI
nr:hypothetical protein GCM10020093_119380 [Planobispora longispora]